MSAPSRGPGPTPPRGTSRRLLVLGLAGLAAIVLLLWLVWGFRWPPTAEVVVEPAPVAEEPR